MGQQSLTNTPALAESSANDWFRAPKARNVTAWGNAPGTRSADTGSAEGA